MRIPLLDLKAQYAECRAEIDKAVAEVMESQHFILGPKVEECELNIARYTGARHAIGVSSGTDALLVCLMTEGIGPGDEVITTPFTFFATVGAIARVGATPVFVDIDPATYNLDSTRVAAMLTPRTRAIVAVHLYGQMADMAPIMTLAKHHGLVVIEDAAQALGAHQGEKRAGSIAHYGCFSFFPSKNLGAAGDAGMVVTNDDRRAEVVRCLRSHGASPKYFHRLVGGNFRLDALQAAIVSAKLPRLDRWSQARRSNAERYDRLFARSGLRVCDSSQFERMKASVATTEDSKETSFDVVVPCIAMGDHIFNQYVIRVARRDDLREFLDRQGISTEIYYPLPMHLQQCFSYLGNAEGSYPESEAAARQTLALPIYPELTDAQAAYVVR
jgi:dTDP-4-amino-4,6-dideoxygalactose transaminase